MDSIITDTKDPKPDYEAIRKSIYPKYQYYSVIVYYRKDNPDFYNKMDISNIPIEVISNIILSLKQIIAIADYKYTTIVKTTPTKILDVTESKIKYSYEPIVDEYRDIYKKYFD